MLTFFYCCRVYLRQKTTWAPFKYFVMVFTFETFHTCGLAILFYVVLPELDSLRGGMLTNGVLFFPSFLLIFRSTDKTSLGKINVYIILALDGE